MGTYSDSKIAVARTTKRCASSRCNQPIQRGTRQLSYKQGLKSRLYLHIDCALANLPGWRCKALEDEADRRIAGGSTCTSPCVGHRCCLPPGHRADHQWRALPTTGNADGK